MNRAADEQLQRRLGVVGWVAAALFCVLVGRIWFLQVISSPELSEVAIGNRTREVVTESPRGSIYDRNGKTIAGLRESLVVTLDWSVMRHLDSSERADLLDDVAYEMNMGGVKVKVDQLEAEFQRASTRSLQPVIVAEDVSEQLWVTLQERSFPGIVAQRRTLRTYPYREVAAHLIGYVGTVQNEDEAAALNEVDDSKPYAAGDQIGRAGLEAEFDRTLRGTPERRLVEVNAQNEVVRTIEVLQPGSPGADLHLTIDVDLQAQTERDLRTQLLEAARRAPCDGCPEHAANAGSAIAVDVTDGSIVASVSYPAYEPGEFLFGMSQEQADYLFQSEDQPFVNRAISGMYAPGSTFKPFTAYAAVTSGLRSPDDIWLDLGRYRLVSCGERAVRCEFSNAKSQALGEVDLAAAISRSSDTYFYAVGEELWLGSDTFGSTPVQDTAEAFGFGRLTGVTLPGERTGRVPTPERRRADHQDNPDAFPNPDWFAGDNVNLAIGQGDLLVTPLQISDAYAAIATGGIRYEPRIVARITDGTSGRVTRQFDPLVAETLALDPVALDAIRAGLRSATIDGTAWAAFTGFPGDVGVAGKTGTTQVNGKADFSLFAGYAPVEAPEYAVAVVLEQAGFGSDAAAPTARAIFDHLVGGVEVPVREPWAEFEPIELPPLLDDDGNAVNGYGQRIDGEGNVLTPEQIAEIDGVSAAVASGAETPPIPTEPAAAANSESGGG